jgi:ketosteroid isomerase-like protein
MDAIEPSASFERTEANQGALRMQPLEIVQAMYQAFGRGDLPAMVAFMDPDIEWHNPGPGEVAYFGTHRGTAAVSRNIFGFIAEHLRFEQFEPREFFSSGDKVAVLLDCVAVAAPSGKRVTQQVMHVFTLREQKVVRFQDFQNSYAVWDALRTS